MAFLGGLSPSSILITPSLQCNYHGMMHINSYPLFSRFIAKDDVTGVTQLKASVQRGIRTKISEQYPALENWVNEIMPKKESIVLIKWFVFVKLLDLI